MKVRKLINSILTFSVVFILFIALPVFEQTAYAGNNLQPKINISSQKIVKGKSFKLRVYNLTDSQSVIFNSSAPGIASVSSDGLVTGISKGNATVTARVFEGNKIVTTLDCSITVGLPAAGVMISKHNLDIEVGDQARLEYILFPLEAVETPVFTSNDESVASVSPGGRVIGEGAGQTNVYCMISNGAYATCEVTVRSKEVPEPVQEPVPTPAPTPEPTEPETAQPVADPTVSVEAVLANPAQNTPSAEGKSTDQE